MLDKLKYILNTITVEPLCVFYMMPKLLSSLSLENMNLEKACLVNLKFNESVCNGLVRRDKTAYTNDEESAVQSLVAGLITYKTVFEGCIPFFLLIFLGTWRDRSGKILPLLILPFFGDIVSCIGHLFCTYYFLELGAEYSVFFETVPGALTGGPALLYMAAFSYIAIISDSETRTVRMGMISLSTRTSTTLGIALAGVMHKYVGFYGVFSICLFFYVAGVCYGFLIKELPSIKKENENACDSFVRFINPKNITDTFSIVVKKRNDGGRLKIIMLMILTSLVFGTFLGEMKVIYMFTRRQYVWNEIQFSFYSTFNTILHLLGITFGLLVFTKYLKWSDAAVGILAVVSKLLESIVQLFSINVAMFYAGSIAGIFSGMLLVVIRSMVSKLVNQDEMGQINSVISIVDSIAPVILGPIYTVLYQYTVATFPAAFFIVTIVFNLPCAVILYWFYMYESRQKKATDTKDVNVKDDSKTEDSKI